MRDGRLRTIAVLALLAGGAACVRPRQKVTAETLELTEKTTLASALAVAHYPRQLRLSQVDADLAALRPFVFGTFDMDDELYISTNKVTTTGILEEYVRILHHPLARDMKGWAETSRRASACLGVYAGIELRATFLGADDKPRRYWSCTFLRAPHGYKLSYVVRESSATTEEPLMRRVLDATEVTPTFRD